MKNTSKLIILSLIATLSFTACKKDSTTPKPTSSSYSMKLTLNGSPVSYSICLAADITASGVKQFNILGSNPTGNDSFAVAVIDDITTLKAGQTFTGETSYTEPNGLNISYFAADNSIYDTVLSDQTSTLTITEVTSTEIKGTFSGKLYAFDDTAGTSLKYTITNGTFTAELPK
jgi:hypothetical protein